MAENPPFQIHSGKGPGDENFPVGSFLVAPALRPHVSTFYAFARAADDIADDPRLPSEEKLRRFDAFEDALRGRETNGPGPTQARLMRRSLAATGLGLGHALDLLAAFRQDAVKNRYRGWNELMAYCELSAAPVGRYLLDLHGEDPALRPQADALCAALQVLNHLQDCRTDHLALGRVYLPQDWMTEAGMDMDELGAAAASKAVRSVLDRALAGAGELLSHARPLPRRLANRRLAMEAAATAGLADRLAVRLARADPLARRVRLEAWEFAFCGARGILAGLVRGRSSTGGGKPAARPAQHAVAEREPEPHRRGDSDRLVQPLPTTPFQPVEQAQVVHHHRHRRA